MAGIPFLHNIDLNNHQLLNAKLHTSDSAPSTPGIGTIWYDSSNDLVKLYDNTATGNVSGWNTITGDITAVTSATTGQLTVANSSGPAPALTIVTAAVSNGGSALATGDHIYDHVTTRLADFYNASSYNASTGVLTLTESDAGTDTHDLGIGTGDSPTFAGLTTNGNITINTSGVTNNIMLVSTDTSADSAPDVVLYRNAGTPVDQDTLGMVEFRGRNAMGSADTADIAYAGIYGVVTDASDQESNIGFSVNKGNGSGAFIRAALISAIGTNNSATGAMIINPATSFSVPTHNLEVNGTADVSGTLTAGAFSGPLTGNVTGNVTGSLIIGGHTVDDIDITSEASNADDHLMTALAIKNRIEDYSYITASSNDTLTNKIITSPDINGGTWNGTVDGNSTAAGITWADLGSVTTIDINGGTINGITDLAIADGGTGQSTAAGAANALLNVSQGGALTVGDSSDTITVGGDLTVTGDLIVSGDTVTVNTATLDVEDLNITVGKAATSSSASNGAGLTFGAWSSGTIPTLTWVHASTYLAVNKNFHVTGNITLSGTVDGIDIATDVAANTAKVTNVSTNLGITGTNAARTITSSDGTNATIPVATTSVSGVMSAAQFDTLAAAQTAANVGTLIDARSSAHTITGDGSVTSFTIDYGFTAAEIDDVIIQVVCSYASDTDHDGDTVYTETERHSTTQCKIKFATAPATGHTYRVLCFKIA